MRFDFEKHLADTQRLTHVGTWEWNVSTDTIIWSEEHYRIFGVRPETFSPSFGAALPCIHPADVPVLQDAVNRAITDHVPFECEYRVVRPDGTVRTVLALGAWSDGEDDAGTRMYGTAQDITERKLLEDALRESERRLRIVLEERERMARDLHDQLIQDLYAIGMSLDAAQATAATNPESVEQIIGAAINGLNGAIRAARAFVEESPPVGDIELDQELQSIASAAEGVRGVRVLLELERDALARIAYDARGNITNIVREAMSNSVRHSAADTIVVSVKERRGGVRLKIEDNGTGFDYRRRRSAGRGLHNMASRAHALGGKLKVKRRLAGGTVITVDIPAERADFKRGRT